MNALARHPDIVWRVEKRREEAVLRALEEGDETASERGTTILIHAGTMHQLNLVGSKIWQLCDGSRTLEGVIDALAGEFEVDRDELAEDVREFADELLRKGWLIHV